VPKKDPKSVFFLREAEFPAACLKGRVHFFDDFSFFKLRLDSKSDRLLVPFQKFLYFFSSKAACAAASRAIGTRNGEQLT
jgi:hypothetical protein